MMNEKFELEVETKGLDEMNEGLEMAKDNAEDLAETFEALDIAKIIIKQINMTAEELSKEVNRWCKIIINMTAEELSKEVNRWCKIIKR